MNYGKSEEFNSNTDRVKKLPLYFHDFVLDEASGKVAAFISTPMLIYGNVAGALVFQLSPDGLNEIMTARTKLLGNTGETYLVNQERKMLTDSYLDI